MCVADEAGGVQQQDKAQKQETENTNSPFTFSRIERSDLRKRCACARTCVCVNPLAGSSCSGAAGNILHHFGRLV